MLQPAHISRQLLSRSAFTCQAAVPLITRVLLAEAVWMAGATRYTNRYRNGWAAAAAVARQVIPILVTMLLLPSFGTVHLNPQPDPNPSLSRNTTFMSLLCVYCHFAGRRWTKLAVRDGERAPRRRCLTPTCRSPSLCPAFSGRSRRYVCCPLALCPCSVVDRNLKSDVWGSRIRRLRLSLDCRYG